MCFSLGWIEQLLVWLVIVCAIVAIIRLLVPWITGMIGMPIVGQVINIVLWAFLAIICIYIIFGLLSCLIGMGGGLHFPPGR
jgi:hypothetical protein